MINWYNIEILEYGDIIHTTDTVVVDLLRWYNTFISTLLFGFI